MRQSSTKYRTTKLVYMMYLIKEKELRCYEQKVLELEKITESDLSHNLYHHKYSLIRIRYKQLKKTIKNLRQLELELDKLNILIIFLGHFLYELF